MKLRFSHVPWLVALFVACSSSSGGGDAPPEGTCAADIAATRFPGGGDGHADPFGAKAAGQARAGKIRDATQIVQPANPRNRVRPGDFILANDKIALYVASEVRADGYNPYGGKILGIEPVGADGRPQGKSQYGESFFLYSRQLAAPDSVTVLADGSDGKAAIVRAAGVLKNLPFIDLFSQLSPEAYDFPVALDYVLEPGAEKVLVRFTMTNTRSEEVDLATTTNFGFFHDYRADTFTEESGFGAPKGDVAFVANDGGDASFLFKVPGSPIKTGLGVSGFQLFQATGGTMNACETKSFDFVEIVAGAGGLDGILETKRRVYGEAPWREVRGALREADGGPPIAGALIHARGADGRYLTRATTAADGSFLLHAPPGGVVLTPTSPGFPMPAGIPVSDGESSVDLFLPRQGALAITAKETQSGEAIPVRVQVIPQITLDAAPASFGVRDPVNNRLHQAFAIGGSATLTVPPGTHRVLISRGYEYEISDTTVTVEAGKTSTVDATLTRSVDSTGVMCADFHVHASMSVDSGDDLTDKVKSAVADGLEIPVLSEHEWVADFMPEITRLGLTKWAYSFPSEELTTFAYGHFGVLPLAVRPDLPNMGAIEWTGKSPIQLLADVAQRPEQPVVIVNHPRQASFAFEAYFTRADFDRSKVTGTPDLWTEQFHGIEVFNGSDFEENRKDSVADWFALLNAGKTFFAVGSSDSHRIRTSPVGYPRTCLKLGHDDPTLLSGDKVRDVLKSGAVTVSGGLMIDVVGPGGAGPGATSQAGAYKVSVLSPSWVTASTLEVIVDGVTTQTLDLTTTLAGAGPGKKAEATVDVQASSTKPRHWVVFHAKAKPGDDLAPLHPGRRPFAVSNPIWF